VYGKITKTLKIMAFGKNYGIQTVNRNIAIFYAETSQS